MRTWQTKSLAKIGIFHFMQEKPFNFQPFSRFIDQTSHDFGNFVSKNQPILIKIGNFVTKNNTFDPFSGLAKNLTKSGRQTKSNKQLKNRRSKPC